MYTLLAQLFYTSISRMCETINYEIDYTYTIWAPTHNSYFSFLSIFFLLKTEEVFSLKKLEITEVGNQLVLK